MGGVLGGGKTKSTTKSTNTVVLPDYLKDIFPDLASRINELSLEEYSPYTGEGVAGLTQDQLGAFQGVRDLLGKYDPYQEKAGQMLDAGSTPLDSATISSYMSPYMQNVVDQQKRGALRDFDIQMNQIGDAAGAAGAFGGDRHAIVESQAYSDVAQRLGDIQTQGLQTAYSDAQNLALSQQQNALNAGTLYNQYATSRQNSDLAGLAALEQIGATQQGQNQQNLNWDLSQWQAEQMYPYDQLNFLSSLIYPMAQITAGSQGTTTTTQKSSSSPLGTALGIGSMLAAPFTGGASMMGSIGSLGGMLGGIGGALGGGMMGLSTGAAAGLNSTQMMRMMRGGSNGMYGPGFKEGGLVKIGGPVQGNFLGELIERLKEKVDSEVPEEVDTTDMSRKERIKNSPLGYDLVSGTLNILNSLRPSTVANDTLQGISDWLNENPDAPTREENEAMYLLQQTAANTASGGKAGRTPTPEIGKFIAENLSDDDIDPGMKENLLAISKLLDTEIAQPAKTAEPSVTPEETPTVDATGTVQSGPLSDNDIIRLIQEQLGGGKKESEESSFNMPLFMFGAATLANNGNVGAGAQAYMETKMSLDKAKAAGEQQAFENQLALGKAETYKLQTEISKQNAEMQQKLFQPKLAQIEAETAKLRAEASAKGDPVSAKAADIFEDKIKMYPNASPERIATLKEQALREAQEVIGLKTGRTSNLDQASSDPLGLLSN